MLRHGFIIERGARMPRGGHVSIRLRAVIRY